jgi:hypothetical protein
VRQKHPIVVTLPSGPTRMFSLSAEKSIVTIWPGMMTRARGGNVDRSMAEASVPIKWRNRLAPQVSCAVASSAVFGGVEGCGVEQAPNSAKAKRAARIEMPPQ